MSCQHIPFAVIRFISREAFCNVDDDTSLNKWWRRGCWRRASWIEGYSLWILVVTVLSDNYDGKSHITRMVRRSEHQWR